jgi:hypothetical protein
LLQKKTSKPKSSNGLMASVTTGLAAKFCDGLERAIVWYFDDYSSKKDMYWLKGNYGPVPEMAPAADLPVSGVIPVRLIASFGRHSWNVNSRFGGCKLVGNVKLVGGMMGMDCGVLNSCGFLLFYQTSDRFHQEEVMSFT